MKENNINVVKEFLDNMSNEEFLNEYNSCEKNIGITVEDYLLLNKIKYVKGDLIKLAKTGMFDVIGHGCNCFNAMGAGIALQIKNEFPIAYIEDCKTIKGDKGKLGIYTRANISLDDISFTILNLYTQYGFGYGSCDYNAIRDCLTKVNIEYKNKRIGLPKIGAGLAGGDWTIIEKIIKETLINLDVTVVEYNK